MTFKRCEQCGADYDDFDRDDFCPAHKLRTRFAYLAGAILGVADKGQSWRQTAIDLTPTGWRFINPHIAEANKIDPREIVTGDFASILSCRAVIARVDKASWGTAMEILFAYNHSIPVLAWGIKPEKTSLWVRAHVNNFYITLNDAIKGLQNV